MNSMKNVNLNNGVKMPILGFGVFQIPAKLQIKNSNPLILYI